MPLRLVPHHDIEAANEKDRKMSAVLGTHLALETRLDSATKDVDDLEGEVDDVQQSKVVHRREFDSNTIHHNEPSTGKLGRFNTRTNSMEGLLKRQVSSTP